MVNVSLTVLQLVLVVFVAVIAYLIGEQIVKVGLKIIFSSKPVMAWNMRRQLEQKKLQKKTELEQMEINIQSLVQFVDWIDKSLGGVDKKSFWRDFGGSKETRNYWTKVLRDMITREKAQVNAPAPMPKPNTPPPPAPPVAK
jgi:hypothetical protein